MFNLVIHKLFQRFTKLIYHIAINVIQSGYHLLGFYFLFLSKGQKLYWVWRGAKVKFDYK